MSPAATTTKKYYGKYRAQVLNNVDPLQIGRVQVTVPGVSGLAPSSWAMPCLPVSGINNGVFALPTIGAGVWVEFEQGHPDHPIWVGGYWGVVAETPTLAKTVPPAVPGFTVQTMTLNGVVINDTPGAGGVTVYCRGVPMIAVTDAGIMIQNGKGAVITMVGPAVNVVGQPVDINVGGLTVV